MDYEIDRSLLKKSFNATVNVNKSSQSPERPKSSKSPERLQLSAEVTEQPHVRMKFEQVVDMVMARKSKCSTKDERKLAIQLIKKIVKTSSEVIESEPFE